ncbi:MAG: SsrA-binding protein, partial [Chthonomonas sp.]|nr:SsrA-binding protein [Chthonomonas sp.]
NTLERKALEKGFALLALGMYFKNGRVKVQVGLGVGKKTYDKRIQIAEKETRREKERMRSEKY